jgi:C-terminal processing protease CtpA/Prc
MTACSSKRPIIITAPPSGPKPVAKPLPKPGKTGLGMTAMEGRLVVSNVLPGSSAQKAGVKLGDRLLRVAGQPVAKLGEAINLLKGYAGTRVELLLERGGRSYEAVLERF